ncbi:hypothetical protein [Promicromonospora sp. NPDC057488]|uniref:hypothetical protein n=1 Tax=Promicromonospora sp. NPDC057488 TaxID=3346147 RepID=UPI00366B995E
MITALRRTWGRQAVTLVTALTVALPVTAAAAVPAAASPVQSVATQTTPAAAMATACSGNRIVHKAIKVGSATVAWLNVFHDRSSGTKCAITSHSSRTWGKWAYTQVDIWTRSSASSVGGDYRYNTGPASVGGVNGVCAGAKGSIKWRGKTRVVTVHSLCG